MVTNRTAIEHIQELIDQLEVLSSGAESFKTRVEATIRRIFPDPTWWVEKLTKIKVGAFPFIATRAQSSTQDRVRAQSWTNWKSRMKDFLKLLKEEAESLDLSNQEEMTQTATERVRAAGSKRIFVVHGRDDEMKQSVARVLEKLELHPVILHERPNKGRTIIEKFTDYSDVGFAVVLLSPDDKVVLAESEGEGFEFRARQNVIFELGFFIGKLGRERVLPLFRKHDRFKMPSDYDGIVFTKFDSPDGAWRLALVGELKAAGYDVDANILLK